MARRISPVLSAPLALAAMLMLAAAAPSVQQEMKSVVEPTTNVLFAVGAEVDPGNGPDAAKVKPDRWTAAAAAAARLKAAAADLLSPAQVRPGDDWTASARALGALADAAEAAATARDGAKLSETANALGDNCTACHSKYKAR